MTASEENAHFLTGERVLQMQPTFASIISDDDYWLAKPAVCAALPNRSGNLHCKETDRARAANKGHESTEQGDRAGLLVKLKASASDLTNKVFLRRLCPLRWLLVQQKRRTRLAFSKKTLGSPRLIDGRMSH